MNYLFLTVAGILCGGIVFGGKILAMMGATPFEVMLYPNLLGALLIFPFAFKNFPKIVHFPLRVNLLFMAAVSVIAVGQYAPLFMNISVTMVLLLLYLQPVWTILIERFYFKKHVPALHWFLVGCMIIGLLFLINPLADMQLSWLGMGLALLAGIGLSIWVLVTQYFSEHEITPSGTYFCTCFYAIAPVMFLYIVANAYMMNTPETQAVLGLEPTEYLWLAMVAYCLFVYTPANVLVFMGNKNVSPSVVGMILLLEPVTGIMLDVIFLHNPLTWNILFGGLIILASNAFLVIKNSGNSK